MPERVSVLSQNLLHGYACGEETGGCELTARLDLFAEQVSESCPDLVGLQEMNQEMITDLRADLPELCEGAYEMVGTADPGLDREVVLSSLPVTGHERFRLAGPFRSALWVRVASDVGVVDLWTTHLASGSDDGACTESSCPPPCSLEDTLNSCQARQIIELAEDRRVEEGVVVIAGDLNATVAEPTIAALLDAGYLDTHLEAGNAECDPATGDQCTSGRDDESMADLADPSSLQVERIDYVLLDAPSRCSVAEGTGLFEPEASEPVATQAGTVPVFASDHTGVLAVIECVTTPEQRDAAATATVVDSTSTTVAAAPEDPAAEQAITEAFTTVFGGGGVAIDERLQALEDPAAVEELFRRMYDQTSEMADRIVVRMDEVSSGGDGASAAVVFSLLLDGNAVVEGMEGTAVLVDGTWRVSTATFCQLAASGTSDVPEACKSA